MKLADGFIIGNVFLETLVGMWMAMAVAVSETISTFCLPQMPVQ